MKIGGRFYSFLMVEIVYCKIETFESVARIFDNVVNL